MSAPAIKCPPWEYENLARWEARLLQNLPPILKFLYTAQSNALAQFLCDTRNIHQRTFNGLTPTTHRYYAGHYRGEEFECLLGYHVSVGTYPGLHPAYVPLQMSIFSTEIRDTLRALDSALIGEDLRSLKAITLARIIKAAAFLFATFEIIHPYANGNGHIGRMIVTVVLHRYGVNLPLFTIHPRPSEPAYTSAFEDWRIGKRDSLEKLLLDCL